MGFDFILIFLWVLISSYYFFVFSLVKNSLLLGLFFYFFIELVQISFYMLTYSTLS